MNLSSLPGEPEVLASDSRDTVSLKVAPVLTAWTRADLSNLEDGRLFQALNSARQICLTGMSVAATLFSQFTHSAREHRLAEGDLNLLQRGDTPGDHSTRSTSSRGALRSEWSIAGNDYFWTYTDWIQSVQD